ncbi:MAG: hypothetical protein MJZ55_03605 [Paludibacteraceae bacterium]|nr:hypothetical protein [Paludibacteraceae bacterium]
MKPGTGPLAAVPPGGRGTIPRSDVEAVSCEDCYAGPQDSAGALRPSTRKGCACCLQQETQVRYTCFGGLNA